MAHHPEATDLDADAAAQRLEAALDRIAAAGARSVTPAGNNAALAEGLDRMITRLRDALAVAPQS